ncbi:hypothetical protein SAMN05192529_14417, partial [Arachidicoccus rhizosphaerae]
MSGELNPVAGIDYVYMLSGSYSGAVWSVTNGTVISSSSTQATIRFNQPSGGAESYGSAHISVANPSPVASLDVTVSAGLSSASLEAYPSTTTPGHTVELYA